MAWLVALMLGLILGWVCLFHETVKDFFFSSPKKEGSKMSEGRHRTKTEDSWEELRSIENLEPWRISHHLYNSMSFDSADDVAIFLASEKRPGRRREWRVWVPQAARWKAGATMEETVTEEEFMDFYLDSLVRQTPSDGQD